MEKKRPTIVIVRHAESLRNKLKKGLFFENKEELLGLEDISNKDIPLTEDGIIQAQKTGVALWKEFGSFDYIYHSGFLRTIQTMKNILLSAPEHYTMKIREDIRLMERRAGYAFNMTEEEVKLYFPWLDAHFLLDGGFMSQPPGGESLSDLATGRVKSFIDMMFNKRAGQKVLIVLHGGTERAMRFNLEKWTLNDADKEENRHPRNCGVTVYAEDFDETQGRRRLMLKQYDKVYY